MTPEKWYHQRAHPLLEPDQTTADQSTNEPSDKLSRSGTLTSEGQSLRGTFHVPGDKISHRSLILGGLAIGTTNVSGLFEGDDVMATANAMRALGVDITRLENGSADRWRRTAWATSPEQPLDLGNSGTGGATMGVVAGQPITATFTGDSVSCGQWQGCLPTRKMGAKINSRQVACYRLRLAPQHQCPQIMIVKWHPHKSNLLYCLLD